MAAPCVEPLRWRMTAGLVVLIAVAGAFVIEFRLYSQFRIMGETVGFYPLHFAGVMAITGFMTGAVAAPIAMLAIGIFKANEIVARRRARRGRCPSCGYQIDGARGVCPECGVAAGWVQIVTRASRAATRLSVLCISGAIVAGAVAAEAWILWDEHEFREEVRALERQGGTGGYHGRARRWPNENSDLIYEPESGFRATD